MGNPVLYKCFPLILQRSGIHGKIKWSIQVGIGGGEGRGYLGVSPRFFSAQNDRLQWEQLNILKSVYWCSPPPLGVAVQYPRVRTHMPSSAGFVARTDGESLYQHRQQEEHQRQREHRTQWHSVRKRLVKQKKICSHWQLSPCNDLLHTLPRRGISFTPRTRICLTNMLIEVQVWIDSMFQKQVDGVRVTLLCSGGQGRVPEHFYLLVHKTGVGWSE